jgi:hypothetical protein
MLDLDGRIAMARRHVESGLDILDRQRRLIERRHALKLDVTVAEDLLDGFEASQAIFEADLFRLLKERDGK